MNAESQRRGDIPVPQKESGLSSPLLQEKAGWKTRPPVIEAEARETDKALKEILEKLGV